MELIKSFDEHIGKARLLKIFFSIVGLDNDFDFPDFPENYLIDVDFIDDTEENFNFEDFEEVGD